jgi:hypothetical protein
MVMKIVLLNVPLNVTIRINLSDRLKILRELKFAYSHTGLTTCPYKLACATVQ